MCRGNRGTKVFNNDADVDLWLDTLGEACERSQMIVHAYCVMNTHYHLLLETPKGNLVAGMKWLQGTFTQRYNARHKQWGHLFQSRYKAKVVDEDPAYFRTAGIYILLNPVDAGLLDLRRKELAEYPWSSVASQLGPPSKRPEWLEAERLISSFGIGADTVAGRRAFAAYLKKRGLALQLKNMGKEELKAWKLMERGWVHGSETFRKAMIEMLEAEGQTSYAHPGEQQRDISEAAAERALEQGFRLLKLSMQDLETIPKSDPRKLLLAGWLRAHFQVSSKWCARAVGLGHHSTATRALNFYRDPPRKWQRSKRQLAKFIDS
jgi:REP element-mobilizing transposase RayT